ncbi:uncharacterized protein KLLA0_A10461g [Kluyveromyces lactis]|uniref:KLLA0A10461p n=1 Tax=Kluyveromyces lactis (strain ATCC 8585 / CBS 2359 / DSM 70799 / NBRC 1267 / NRRL Y-1140 / WM37) TaxID=284590 RepID=Q6CX81_KLULA|nr:uncharacterized protein KLLA0_A10461g [Kluyveromyces lactis]CAH03046.1 KLLA0A10461p [Kluyveromyces lactis]|eukprot:XP_451458.1 uncharacterized protein KLLA0_A10461g [Kluyveromyces lactis]
MYIPSHLEVTDLDKQVSVIKQYPLGVLFNYNSAKTGLLDYFKSGKPPSGTDRVDSVMCATHVPFHYVEDPEGKTKGKLIAHLAGQNQHIAMLEENANCLVVFQSVDSYVSPEWYPLKKKTHKFVPTWDFACVHVYGRAKIIHDDEEWLLGMLNSITDQEEKKRPDTTTVSEKDEDHSGEKGEVPIHRWKVEEAEKRYLSQAMKNIVGLEIEIDHVQSKFKFHQDQPPVNVNGVLDGYAKELDPKKAQELEKFTRQQYPREL